MADVMRKSKKTMKPLQILSELLAVLLLYAVSSVLSFLLCVLIAREFIFKEAMLQADGRARMAVGIGAVMVSGMLSGVVMGPLMTLVFFYRFGREKKSSSHEKRKNITLHIK